MKRFFITGGEGFIGYHICKQLLGQGHEVMTYDAQKHYIPLDKSRWMFYQMYRVNDLNGRIQRVRGDTTDRGLLKDSLEQYRPDVIIHLAALPIASVSNIYPEEAHRNIYDGLVTVLDVLRETSFDVDRFVYTSSSMVYGDFLRDENGAVIPADESQRCRPLGLYGAMKLGGEELVYAYHKRFGIPFTIIRPSAVYGPTDCNRRVTEIFLYNALEGKPLRLDNGGKHQLDFTFVEDTAQGFILASLKKEGLNECFNITRGEGRSIRDLAMVIKDLVPSVEVTVEELEVYRPNRGSLDISKAQELLGYNPRFCLEDGMKNYYDFIKKVEG